MRGDHDLASQLLCDVAELALTPGGAMVLLERAHLEACLAEQAFRLGSRWMH